MKFGFRLLRNGFLLIGLAGFVLNMERGRAEPSSAPDKLGVEMKAVKYNGLTEAVRAQRGKVVVVEIWGFF